MDTFANNKKLIYSVKKKKCFKSLQNKGTIYMVVRKSWDSLYSCFWYEVKLKGYNKHV